MSYGTFRVRRSIPHRYLHRLAGTVSRSLETPLIKKTAACLAIFAVVWVTVHLPLAPARSLASIMRRAFTSDWDFSPVFSLVKRLAEGIPETSLWALPATSPAAARMMWPVEGRLAALYGWRTDPVSKQERLYEGIDVAAPAGTPIRAALSGVVVDVRDSAAYGKVIEIEHGRGFRTVYSRCTDVAVILRARVERGDVIARVGALPGAGSPYMHFEVVVDGNRVDPLKYLPAL